jgi:hypothetical protein
MSSIQANFAPAQTHVAQFQMSISRSEARKNALEVLAQVAYGQVSQQQISDAWQNLARSQGALLDGRDKKVIAQLMLHEAHFIAGSDSKTPVRFGVDSLRFQAFALKQSYEQLVKLHPDMSRLPEIQQLKDFMAQNRRLFG